MLEKDRGAPEGSTVECEQGLAGEKMSVAQSVWSLEVEDEATQDVELQRSRQRDTVLPNSHDLIPSLMIFGGFLKAPAAGVRWELQLSKFLALTGLEKSLKM